MRAALLSLIALCAVAAVHAQAPPGTCDESPGFYEAEGYSVRRVAITTALDWLPPVRRSLDKVAAGLPLQARRSNSAGQIVQPGRFRAAAFSEGQDRIKEGLGELQVTPALRVAVRLIWPSLENCSAESKSLDVVYRVYTLGIPDVSRLALQSRGEEFRRSVPSTTTSRLLQQYRVQPALGYNAARGTFGGGSLALKLRNPVFTSAALEALGSGSSLSGKAELAGSHVSNTGSIVHSDWRLGYAYSDMPAADFRLSEAAVRAQFSAATRALSSPDLIVRWGGLVEGGHKQTSLGPGQAPAGDLRSTAFTASKAFVGVSMRAGRHAFQNSYAIQLGGAGDKPAVDYLKQIVDSNHSLRFVVGDHRMLTVDSHFGAGWLSERGPIPAAEHFFGGNVARDFILGENLHIAGAPLIRSFAENGFVYRDPTGNIAGNRFFSYSATVAFTAWGYPLVPRVVLADPAFDKAIAFELEGAQLLLRNQYLGESAQFRELAQQLTPLQDVVVAARAEFDRIAGQAANDAALGPAVASTALALKRVEDSLGKSIANLNAGKLKTADIQALTGAHSEDCDEDPCDSYLLDLVAGLERLEAALVQSGVGNSPRVAEIQSKLQATHRALYADLLAVETSAAAADAEGKAERYMRYPRRVVNTLVHDANLAGISPVGLFDAARIWQTGQAAPAVRYAVGGGVRVSFVCLDLTAGYAWNVHRAPGEGRGAFVFTFAVSDLFR